MTEPKRSERPVIENPEAPAEKPEKKIAIVGFTASKSAAPWGEEGWEIWICNNLWKHCPPDWSRLYDLHEAEEIVKDKEHDAFLRGQVQKHADGKDVRLGKREVVCFEPKKEWPTSKAFPRDEITNNLGNYFTNSISWMIAHALMEGVTELHVYGVDMATGGEYAAQRPSCEYLLGIAVGMGVKVYVPPQSDLLKSSALYGTGADTALHAKMLERRQELTERARNLEQQASQAQIQLAQIQGALETTNYIIDVWTNARAERDGSPKGLEEIVSENGATPEEVAV